MTIMINTFDKIKDFCAVANRFSGEILIKSGKYIINGKSLMGLFSLDLSNPVTIEVEYLGEETRNFHRYLIKNNFFPKKGEVL